jgi:hypothetical protein
MHIAGFCFERFTAYTRNNSTHNEPLWRRKLTT